MRVSQTKFLKDIKILAENKSYWYVVYDKTVNDIRENIIGNYMETLLEVISGHASRSTKQVVKKMLLLKVIRSFDTGYRQYLWMNKRPSRYKEACWWNYDVGNSVIEKHKL